MNPEDSFLMRTSSESLELGDRSGEREGMPPLLLYDDRCPLCRTLGELMERRAAGALTLSSWQDYGTHGRMAGRASKEFPLTPPDLALWTPEGLRYGPPAWEALLALHPDFEGLRWLAAKLGLTRELGRVVGSTAHLLRRLCRRCPR